MGIPGWFNLEKATQMAFFFEFKAGMPMDRLHMAGLIYLANRSHMKKAMYPIADDDIVAMEHGPVSCFTLEHVVGSHKSRYIVPKSDALSPYEMDTLSDVWDEFGEMDDKMLLAFIRRECSEWSPPGADTVPIYYESVFRALGFREPDVLAREIEVTRDIEMAFAELRD